MLFRNFPGGLPLTVWTTALLGGTCIVGLSLYEFAAFGWHPAREEAALFSPYHWARMALSLGIGSALVFFLVRSRDPAPPLSADAMSVGEWIGAGLSLIAAISATAIFLISPAAFHAMIQEDNAIEWASALLLLMSSVLFALVFVRQLGSFDLSDRKMLLRLLVSAGFAGLYFVMGMEEISWMQRVIGFDTPDSVSQINWQSEFNLHNIHTDIFECVFFGATALFLIVVPLLRATFPAWAPLVFFAEFLPGRAVAAISAPMMLFTYGKWNLLPFQLLAVVACLAMFVFARDAAKRGARHEAWLFDALFWSVLVGQILFLAFGHRMLDVPEATEVKELFISLGLIFFAVQYFRTARTGSSRQADAAP